MNQELTTLFNFFGINELSLVSFLCNRALNNNTSSTPLRSQTDSVFFRRLVQGQSFWIGAQQRAIFQTAPEPLTTVGLSSNLVTFFVGARTIENIQNFGYMVGELNALQLVGILGAFNGSQAAQQHFSQGMTGMHCTFLGEGGAPLSPPVLTNQTALMRFGASITFACVIIIELVRRERDKIQNAPNSD